MIGVRPAPPMVKRNYFSSRLRVFLHEVDFKRIPILPELHGGTHYAVKSCSDRDLIIREIQGILLRCISDDPQIPAGFKNGVLPPSCHHVIKGGFTEAERDYLYSFGVNPIKSKAGKSCLWGQKLITNDGHVRNIVMTKPYSLSMTGSIVDESFREIAKNSFVVQLTDFDSGDISQWCSDNTIGDFLCTFATTNAHRTASIYFEQERDAALFKLFFYSGQ